LKDYHINLNHEKSEYTKKEVTFLRAIISREGLHMEPDKVKAIQEWPIPTMIKEVQAFLGFANYYRWFIRNYSRYTILLTQLTRKDQSFEWKKTQQKAFESIKALFKNEYTLQSHDLGKKMVVEILKPESIMQEHDPQKKQTIETDASQ